MKRQLTPRFWNQSSLRNETITGIKLWYIFSTLKFILSNLGIGDNGNSLVVPILTLNLRNIMAECNSSDLKFVI